MKIREDLSAAASHIISRVEEAGYAVSVHRMREYVELHAVSLTGEEPVHIARCEGDSDDTARQAALSLAEMVPAAPDG